MLPEHLDETTVVLRSRSPIRRAESPAFRVRRPRARSRPCAPAMLQMTMAIVARRRPAVDGVDDGLKIRSATRNEDTQARRHVSDVGHRTIAGGNSPDARWASRFRECRSSTTASTSAGGHTRIMPIPMLNVRSMSSSGTAASVLEPPENRWHIPRRSLNARCRAFGQHPREIVGDATAGNVRDPFDGAFRNQRIDGLQVGAMRRQEHLANRARAQFLDLAVHRQTEVLEHDATSQRIAVGVKPVEGNPIRVSPTAMLRPSINI